MLSAPQIRTIVVVAGMACFLTTMNLFIIVGALAFGGGDHELEFSLFCVLPIETLLLIVHSLKSDSQIGHSKIWLVASVVGIVAACFLLYFIASSPFVASFGTFSVAVSLLALISVLAYSCFGVYHMFSK